MLDPQQRRRAGWQVTAAAAIALAVTGCQSSSPEPTEMSRTTLQTAPADLQLLCANAVATKTGASSDQVLPVSSRQVGASSFQVELDAGGVRHNCVVDSEGNVTSVGTL